jgi:hypothetical protein
VVKFQYAFDEQGNIEDISNLSRGDNHGSFTCLTCGEPMKARLGKGVDKGGNTPHFAHYSASFNHADESELHYNTKGYLFYTLSQILNSEDEKEFKIKVFCNDCNLNKTTSLLYGLDNESIEVLRTWGASENFSKKSITHLFDYDLLQDVTHIKLEKKVDNFIPDVSLYHEDTLIKAIEVVHTHEDEESKVEYYQDKKVDVIHVYVENDDDLKDLKNGILDMIQVSLNYTFCVFKEPISKGEIINNLHIRRMQEFRYMSEILMPFFSDIDDCINSVLIRNRRQHIEKQRTTHKTNNKKTVCNPELYEMIRDYSEKHRVSTLTSYDLQQFIIENPQFDFEIRSVLRHIKMGNACSWKNYITALEHYMKYKLYNKF